MSRFVQAAGWVGTAAGHPITLAIHLALVLVWISTGPFFRWSDTWQVTAVNVMTIETLLLALVIQNSQNRNSAALHLKLDDLLLRIEAADNQMVGLEQATDEILKKRRKELESLAADPQSQ